MPKADHYSWWRRSMLRNMRPGPVVEDEPQCGYYKRRVRQGGPYVPGAIWMEGDEMLAELDGKPADPLDQWLWFASRPIPYREYLLMKSTKHRDFRIAPPPF